jgi:hypothetical protein
MNALKWQKALFAADTKVKVGIRSGLVKIGQAVSTQAKTRVPVSSGAARDKATGRFKSKGSKAGHLRQSIRYEVVGTTAVTMEARIGTNVEYGVFVEYGTDRIAGGAVKALGMGDQIQDSQAIFSWPALAARNGKEQQMPWLRPAAFMYRAKAKGIMITAMNRARKIK